MDYTKYSVKPLVLGLLSVILSFFIFTVPVSYVLGIIGTIMGYKAIQSSGKTGFVLSLIGMIISSIVLYLALYSVKLFYLFLI